MKSIFSHTHIHQVFPLLPRSFAADKTCNTCGQLAVCLSTRFLRTRSICQTIHESRSRRAWCSVGTRGWEQRVPWTEALQDTHSDAAGATRPGTRTPGRTNRVDGSPNLDIYWWLIRRCCRRRYWQVCQVSKRLFATA